MPTTGFPAADVMLPSEHRAKTLANLQVQMQVQEAQRKAQAESQLRQFYQQHGPGIAAGEPGAIDELARLDPTAAQEASSKATANRRAEFDFESAEFKAGMEQMTALQEGFAALNYVSEELRPMLYKQQRAQYARRGWDVSDVPEEYDPNWVKFTGEQLTTVDQRLRQMQADPEYLARKAEAERPSLDRVQAEATIRERTAAQFRAPTAASGGRPLPTPQINQLVEVGGRVDTLERLENSFQDNYGGSPMGTGTIENFIGRTFGDPFSAGQAQWWQDYQAFKNETRHAQFGASLTPTEKAEFERMAVNPGMAPSQIRTNLARQRAIVDTAMRRRARALSRTYSRESIEDAMGRPLDGGGAPTDTGGGDDIPIGTEAEGPNGEVVVWNGEAWMER